MTQSSNFCSSLRAKNPAPASSTRTAPQTLLRLCAPFLLMAALSLVTSTAFAQPAAAPAAEAPKFDLGDSAWMLVSSALVLLMTPGLAFFYGGLVRGKNVLNTIMMSYGAMAILGIAWVIIGYSIAFGGGGEGIHNYIGGLDYAFFNGVGYANKYADAHTIPHMLFAVFQGMFFIITPALISGSLVERMKFTTFFIYMAAWGLLVYCPVAHWVWGGGWIGDMGVMDFAGGAVVHVNAGFAALAACLVLKPRKGYGSRPMLPHSLPLCLLGVGLLWFGWFGFNAGSALSANGLGVLAFTNTQIGAAAAMLMWMILDQITRKEMTALGAGTGAVAGLVGITPACGFVSPMGALFVGAITSAVCYLMATLRAKGPVDDSLDAFAVHGVGGFTGAVLTGIFSVGAIGDPAYIKTLTGMTVAGDKTNTLSLPGLLEGGTGVFLHQILATGAVAIYTFVMSYIICLVLKAVMGLRASDEAEERGLDVSLHGEEAYATESA
ncbi:ammonium transporter [Abditibacteriota bacterium]|nr:ammonium transporter [Abditibacteriota bacterium]